MPRAGVVSIDVRIADENGEVRTVTMQGANVSILEPIIRHLLGDGVLTSAPVCGNVGGSQEFVMPTTEAEAVRAETVSSVADAWKAHLEARGRAPRYVAQAVQTVKSASALRGWTDLESVTAREIDAYITGLSASGTTRNRHLGYLSAFLGFCWRTERIRENTARRVVRAQEFREGGNRAFSAAEAAAIIAVARADAESAAPRFKALDRWKLYLTAWHTGLRRLELRTLEVREVRLGDQPPRIVLRPRTAKSKKEQVIPLHPELVPVLRSCCAGKDSRDRVFSFLHDRVVPEDIKAAGINPRDGEVTGLHSFRKGMATELALNGVDEATAQKLLRHSDPRLTRNVYTDARLLPLASSVARIRAVTGNSGDEKISTNNLDTGTDSADAVGAEGQKSMSRHLHNTDHQTPGRDAGRLGRTPATGPQQACVLPVHGPASPGLATVAESADAVDSKSTGLNTREGSTPSRRSLSATTGPLGVDAEIEPVCSVAALDRRTPLTGTTVSGERYGEEDGSRGVRGVLGHLSGSAGRCEGGRRPVLLPEVLVQAGGQDLVSGDRAAHDAGIYEEPAHTISRSGEHADPAWSDGSSGRLHGVREGGAGGRSPRGLHEAGPGRMAVPVVSHEASSSQNRELNQDANRGSSGGLHRSASSSAVSALTGAAAAFSFSTAEGAGHAPAPAPSPQTSPARAALDEADIHAQHGRSRAMRHCLKAAALLLLAAASNAFQPAGRGYATGYECYLGSGCVFRATVTQCLLCCSAHCQGSLLGGCQDACIGMGPKGRTVATLEAIASVGADIQSGNLNQNDLAAAIDFVVVASRDQDERIARAARLVASETPIVSALVQ